MTSAVVVRVLPAPPEIVYDEWLDPEALAEFLCPTVTTTTTVDIDPRIGGHLRIVMADIDVVATVTGEYLELDRPRRLRFSWHSDLADDFDSVVTVTLAPHGVEQTLMTIDQTALPPGQREAHVRGWSRIADQLALWLDVN
jgi:uncharacterized protein YndB with AHSA1/START domain